MTDWTLQDIRSAARVANSRCRMSPQTARDDLDDIAQSAVGLAVAENPDLSWSDAVSAAASAVYDAVSVGMREHGQKSTGQMPRWIAYWTDDDMVTSPPATQCVSRLALEAVMRDLPERHVRTLWAQAFADSTAMAAESQGVKPHTFVCRLIAARKTALALLYDHEEPPSLSRLPIVQRRKMRTCPSGHEISGENVEVERKEGRIVERCKRCRRDQNRKYKREALA